MKKYLLVLTVALLTITSCSNNIYTVTFKTSGGTPVPAKQRVNDGGKAIAPASNPVKDGHIFAFWYLNGETAAYDFQTPVTGDITLYSKWLPVPDDIFTVMEDENFRNCCQIFDTNKDGRLSPEEAASVKRIEHLYYGVKSLAGIEYFTSLTYLDCSHSELKNLDLSANVNLEYLNCERSGIENLNISANTALKELYCLGNYIYFLDVSGKKNLKKLDCSSTNLKTLDVSGCTSLEELICNSNMIKDLDLSTNTSLKILNCSTNGLQDLDLSRNSAITILKCGVNSLTNLDVSGNKNLTELDCGYSGLTNLNVKGTQCLKKLYCKGNNLISLDLSTNPALESLFCGYNQLTGLDISSNKILQEIYCDGNPNLNEIKVWNGFDLDTPSNSIPRIEKDGHAVFVTVQ